MPENVLDTIILDDNPSFREFLREFLDGFEGVKVIAETDSAKKALELVNDCRPGLIFVDIRLQGMNGLEFAEVLKQRFPGIRAVIITLYDNKLYRREASRLGFPYIPKSSILDDVPRFLKELGIGKH